LARYSTLWAQSNREDLQRCIVDSQVRGNAQTQIERLQRDRIVIWVLKNRILDPIDSSIVSRCPNEAIALGRGICEVLEDFGLG
jgi:hypothetical protein